MVYHFKQTDASIQESVREIATSQIDKAICEVEDSDLGIHETIHQIRKRCKKLRGLIRLVRPQFRNYGEENKFFRNLAAKFSSVRDAKAMVETYDDLIDLKAYDSIRCNLSRHKEEVTRDTTTINQLSVFADKMSKARERAQHWKISNEDFETIAGGLGRTYKRARKAQKSDV